MDEHTDETVDFYEDYPTTEEAAIEVAKGDLFPDGVYRGQLIAWTTRVQDKFTDDPLYGKPVSRCRADLYLESGKTRPFFFNATSVMAHREGKDGVSRVVEGSKNGVDLATATGTVGKHFERDTLPAAKDLMLEWRVYQYTDRNGTPRNGVRKIRVAA